MKLNVDKLKELQKQMHYENKYDNDVQASPRFWVVGDYKWVEASHGNAERYSIYIPEYADVYGINEFIKDELEEIEHDYTVLGELAEEALDDAKNINCELSALEWIKEYIDRDADLVPERQVHHLREDTLFLTKKDAKEHIEKNRHHYTDRVHTFAMTGWRSESYELVWNMLMDVDWDKYNN